MRVTKEVKASVEKYVHDLVSSKPKGGEMTLDEICAKFPNTSRWEIVSALRHISDGIFVTGRRGLKSRFMYGDAAKPMIAAIKYRQEYRAKHPKSDAQQDTPAHSSERVIVSQSMALRIGIGDRTAIIPISIEMVPA